MRLSIITILVFISVFSAAQTDSVLSGVYYWQQPVKKAKRNIKSAVLFEGKTHDMQWMKVSGNILATSKKENKIKVPQNEEQIIIVKKGVLDINLDKTNYHLVSGSVIVLLPGESASVVNLQADDCEYYHLQYKSKMPVNTERGKKAGGSFVKDFRQIEFKPHDKGGIRNYFERPTAMGKRLEMHVTTLNPGIKSHEPHTHRAEEIVLMIEGNTEMQIDKGFKQGSEGALYYLGSNVPHAIRNIGKEPCMYFAFQFE